MKKEPFLAYRSLLTGTDEVKEPLSLKSEIFKDVTKSNTKL